LFLGLRGAFLDRKSLRPQTPALAIICVIDPVIPMLALRRWRVRFAYALFFGTEAPGRLRE
jgi:hypothetical protein